MLEIDYSTTENYTKKMLVSFASIVFLNSL